MKMRKASARVMAAAMSASMFVVPAAADETEDPAKAIPEDVIPDETVTLNVFDQLANYSGEQIGWFGQVMLEKFNVKLNIIPDSDGTYETRMESGDLGDLVIWGNDGDEYLQAVDKGMLFDWNEDDILADYGPYIAEHMQHLRRIHRFPAEQHMELDLILQQMLISVRISCMSGIFAGIFIRSLAIQKSKILMIW